MGNNFKLNRENSDILIIKTVPGVRRGKRQQKRN